MVVSLSECDVSVCTVIPDRNCWCMACLAERDVSLFSWSDAPLRLCNASVDISSVLLKLE